MPCRGRWTVEIREESFMIVMNRLISHMAPFSGERSLIPKTSSIRHNRAYNIFFCKKTYLQYFCNYYLVSLLAIISKSKTIAYISFCRKKSNFAQYASFPKLVIFPKKIREKYSSAIFSHFCTRVPVPNQNFHFSFAKTGLIKIK